MMLLRSVAYNLFMWASVLVYAPLMLLTAPLPFVWRYRLISAWARFHVWLARGWLGIKYHVEGREHIPHGAAIIMSKHQSTWETLALTAIFPPLTFILKRELMWIPLFGWAIRLINPIAIDRGAGRDALDQIVRQGRARLEDGIWIVVFPEGTRVAPGQRRPYKKGGAVLAAETGYPVVPVAHNAGTFWPRRSVVKKPGTIRVVIGAPIVTRGKSAAQVLSQVEDWIEHTTARLEGREK
jgi:1-acyl-sn-glycerol-3-phosphate acyltransferase